MLFFVSILTYKKIFEQLLSRQKLRQPVNPGLPEKNWLDTSLVCEHLEVKTNFASSSEFCRTIQNSQTSFHIMIQIKRKIDLELKVNRVTP